VNIPWMSDQMRAIAAQNLKQFSRAAAEAASTALPDDPADIKVDESLKLDQKAFLPLHMKRAETQKQVPLNSQKGRPRKQQQQDDDDAMQE
jgi:hypothetical protein